MSSSRAELLRAALSTTSNATSVRSSTTNHDCSTDYDTMSSTTTQVDNNDNNNKAGMLYMRNASLTSCSRGDARHNSLPIIVTTTFPKHNQKNGYKPRHCHFSHNNNNNNARNYHTAKTKRPSTRVMKHDFAAFVAQTRAGKFKVHRPGCHCGKIKQLQSRLVGEGKNFVDKIMSTQQQGFWIVSKGLDYVFQGVDDVTADLYHQDPLRYEETLRQEIFEQAESATSTSTSSSNAGSFKISCAECMLQDYHPNGFVCVLSPDKAVVDLARDMAQTAMQQNQGRRLHHDHAHYVCTIALNMLPSPSSSREKEETALRETLQQQGVPIPDSKGIKLGHHIKAVRGILSREEKKNNDDNPYILIMLYKDKTCYEMDLPGGKRRLGESSFDCARRETAEEISLHVDASWLIETAPRFGNGPSDQCNAFYLVAPPPAATGEAAGEEDNVQDLVDELAKLELKVSRK